MNFFPRKPRGASAAEDDGLVQEEIVEVRERCQKMIAAAEAAGGKWASKEARKALMATVFETHPYLDEQDIETYLALRGLVSDRNRRTSSHTW